MIELTDIAYVRSGVSDLDKAVTFATEIVGLELIAPVPPSAGAARAAGAGAGPSFGPGPGGGEPSAPAGRVAQLRADSRHHCLALVEGPSGVIASGFAVADEDALAAAESRA